MKKCFICFKEGCWSTKHTPEERRKGYERYRTKTQRPTKDSFQQFLYEFEGIEVEDWESDEDEEVTTDQLIAQFESERLEDQTEQFLITVINTSVNGPNLLSILNDKATFHQFTRSDLRDKEETEPKPTLI